MGRTKKNWVTHITSKDEGMLKSFVNVGHLNKTMLKNNLGQNDNRIRNFEKDGYIAEKDYLNKETKNIERVYELTEKGRNLCVKEFNTEYFYKSNSAVHDLGLAERYLQESPENRLNWVTETQLREEFKSHIEDLREVDKDRYYDLTERYERGEISVPDGAIRTGGVTRCIEVVTANYSASDRESKVNYAEEMDITLEIERV